MTDAENEADEAAGLDLQSLPVDALELIVAKLNRKQVTTICRQCRSLREAGLATLRGSLRGLLDRSAHELSVLRNQALIMREQSLAASHYNTLALLITTSRLVRMELRMLAAATWRHLCAPFGPGVALPGSLLDQIESVLDSVTSGKLTSAVQPEETAGLYLRCEKFLEFFSEVLEPPLAQSSVEWAPFGSRLADALAATHTRRIHKEALTRTGQGVRLTATYRLPGLVEAPPLLPRTPPPLSPFNQKCEPERTAHAGAAENILSYLRRSVHMHNLVLVLKDQWAMDDVIGRRGSTELQSGFIFDQHDQPGECRVVRSDTNTRSSIPNSNKRKSQNRWDGLLCELQMNAPSIHLLPPHLQHLTNQIWPQSSTDTFESVTSCPSIRVTAPSVNPSSSSFAHTEKRANSRGAVCTPDLSRKSTRAYHSLMTVNGMRNGDSDNLQKSLSFDNVDAVKAVLRRLSRQDHPLSTSSLGADLASSSVKAIKTVDLSVVGNSCVCFSFTDLEDGHDDITRNGISDKPNEWIRDNTDQLHAVVSPHQVTSVLPFSTSDAYYFRLRITARYPEPDKTKSGLREATISVVDSEDGPYAWLLDDVPVC